MNLPPVVVRGETWMPYRCVYQPEARHEPETVYAKNPKHARFLLGSRAHWLLGEPRVVELKEAEHAR